MTETKKTLIVIKARLGEVVLIIGLCTLGMISANNARPEGVEVSSQQFVFMLFAAAVTVLSIMLKYGFLRSVYQQGVIPQEPKVLLRMGMHFFWRMTVLGMLYMGASLFIMTISYSMALTEAPEQAEQLTGRMIWIPHLFFMVFNIAISKLIILLPALIIVLDCGIFRSFGLLREYRLLSAKELIVLFAIYVAFNLVWGTAGNLVTSKAAENVLLVLCYVVIQFVSIMIGLTAIRYVAYVRQSCDNAEELPDAQEE